MDFSKAMINDHDLYSLMTLYEFYTFKTMGNENKYLQGQEYTESMFSNGYYISAEITVLTPKSHRKQIKQAKMQ